MKEYIMRYENEVLQLLPDRIQPLIRCKDCKKKGNSYLCRFDRDLEEHGGHRTDEHDTWFCADGVAKDTNVLNK